MTTRRCLPQLLVTLGLIFSACCFCHVSSALSALSAPAPVLLVSLGQSNNQGEGCCYNTSVDYGYDNMLQYVINDGFSDRRYLPNITAVAYTLTHATEPMYDGGNNRANIIGSLVALGRLYTKMLSPDPPQVILVQAAVSGTSITQWLPGGLLARSIRAVTNATRLAPDSSVSMFTWVQGESDSGRPTSSYLSDLITLINIARNSTPGASASTPFIVGSMVPEWTASAPSSVPIMQAHRMLPNLIPFTAYRQMLYGFVDCVEGIHFGASGQRLMGGLMLEGYQDAVYNARPGLIPNHTMNLTVTCNADGAVLNWLAAPPNPTAPVDHWIIRWKFYDRPSNLGPYPNCTDQNSTVPNSVRVPVGSSNSWSITTKELGMAGTWQFYVGAVSGTQQSSGRYDSWVLCKIPQSEPASPFSAVSPSVSLRAALSHRRSEVD